MLAKATTETTAAEEAATAEKQEEKKKETSKKDGPKDTNAGKKEEAEEIAALQRAKTAEMDKQNLEKDQQQMVVETAKEQTACSKDTSESNAARITSALLQLIATGLQLASTLKMTAAGIASSNPFTAAAAPPLFAMAMKLQVASVASTAAKTVVDTVATSTVGGDVGCTGEPSRPASVPNRWTTAFVCVHAITDAGPMSFFLLPIRCFHSRLSVM